MIATLIAGLVIFAAAVFLGAFIRSAMDLREARDFWEKHGADDRDV
jgi:hypothetical protein